jgi:hypothetical protein
MSPEQEIRRTEQVDDFVEEIKARASLWSRVRRGVGQYVARKLDVPANVVKLMALCCVVWIVVTTFGPMPVGLLKPDGTLCPRETVCAETWHALLLLGISRTGAYFCCASLPLDPAASGLASRCGC